MIYGGRGLRPPARIVLPVLLGAAVLAVFWPALGNDFVNYDDDQYVTGNPRVQQGLDVGAVRWAFTTDAARQLAPAHVALAHARLGALGRRRRAATTRRASCCTR